MNRNNEQLGALDILAIISFIIQLENQGHIIGIQDIQGEVDRAIDKLNSHLEIQDSKIDKIMEALGIENYQEVE